MKNKYYFLIFSFLLGYNVWSSLNSDLTVLNSTCKTVGVKDSGAKLYEDFCLYQLKRFGLVNNSEKPTTAFTIMNEKGYVELNVKSMDTGAVIFQQLRKSDENLDSEDRKILIESLIIDFYEALPYQGVVYAKNGNKIKISQGEKQKVSIGQEGKIIRFTGETPRNLKLKEELPYEIVGKVNIVEVFDDYSIGTVSLKVNKYDKIIFESSPAQIKKPEGNTNRTTKKFKIKLGTSTGILKTKNSSQIDSSYLVPDSSKKMNMSSFVPYLYIEAQAYKNVRILEEFQYRKLKIIKADETEIKATYFTNSLSAAYNVKNYSSYNNYKAEILLSAGLFTYFNTVPEKLLAYLSTKYYGMEMGIKTSVINHKAIEAYGTFKLYPYLLLKEDKFKRGTSAFSYGFYGDFGSATVFYKHFGVDGAFYGRYLISKFSGTPDPEFYPLNMKFYEYQLGLRLALTFDM